MPDTEQLGIICLLGLLLVLYVFGFIITYLAEYWYIVVTVIASLIAFRVWWRHRNPVYLDDEDDDLEPVIQE